MVKCMYYINLQDLSESQQHNLRSAFDDMNRFFNDKFSKSPSDFKDRVKVLDNNVLCVTYDEELGYPEGYSEHCIKELKEYMYHERV